MQKVKIPLSITPAKAALKRMTYDGVIVKGELSRLLDVAELLNDHVNVSISYYEQEMPSMQRKQALLIASIPKIPLILHSISPQSIDLKSYETIKIWGEGFKQALSYYCCIGTSFVFPASRVTSSNIDCEIPPSLFSSAMTVPVSLSMNSKPDCASLTEASPLHLTFFVLPSTSKANIFSRR